ncbi:MAG: FKBP-type peptidyl-prolyl cis-trans isomerase [Gemmatimonadota bacterium]|nr:MAG: FKBP-type peptidyl-prolyl cis-trans isomerase [Gemmatimonadota bacterium]
MAEAKTGDRVKVHYRGTLKDGTEFDSSHGGDPLEFTLGEAMVIAGFENAVVGMEEGETKAVSIPPEDGYGPRVEELVAVVQRSALPADLEPEVGMVLEAKSENGEVTVVTVTDVADDTVTLDANHELAGEELIFEIQLVAVA